MAIAIVLSLTFSILGCIHVYWAFGGHWALTSVIPTDLSGNRLFQVGPFSCIVVAAGLFMLSFFYLIDSGIVQFSIPDFLGDLVRWLVPFVFLLRAIGDFRYCGLFKKISTTEFAVQDTRIFIPLCLFIAGLSFIWVVYTH